VFNFKATPLDPQVKKFTVTIEEGFEWFPRIRLGASEKTKFLPSAGNRNTTFQLFSPWPSHCTDHAAHSRILHTVLLPTINLQVSVHVGTQHLPQEEEGALHPIPPLTGFLRCWSQKGLGSSPVLSRESPRTVQYLLDVLAVGYTGRLTNGESPESRVRILAES
jgi:hypothetical protein